MKALRMFVLAAVLLLASLVMGTSRVSAQGPITFADVLAKLRSAGADIQMRKVGNYCYMKVALAQTEPLVKGYSSAWLLKLVGLPINSAVLYDLGLYSNWNDGTTNYAEFMVDPSFCNPPPGTSPAQNPAPAPVRPPHPSHEDPANLMAWGIAGLVALGVGFLLFPPFRRAFVRI